MTVFSSILDVLKKNSEIEWMFDLDFINDTSQRVYLKKMAIDSVLNLVGRTMSMSKFQFRQGKKSYATDWDYILNVRPNKDMSAATFWQSFFYKLMFDNEVLVIVSDDNQLLIADDFFRNEYAVYEDTFENVVVKDYEFKRVFPMSKVIYLEYNNEELAKFTDGLFSDYGELFGRILEVSMRNNQIRGTVSIDDTATFNDKRDANGKTRVEKMQEFMNKLFKAFKTSSVAIVPKSKNFSYDEYTNKVGSSNQSLKELDDMKKSLISDVARAIGVPPALALSENAELSDNLKAFKKLCVDELIKKLQDELNAKLLDRYEYRKGKRVRIFGVLQPDIFDLATSIEKLTGSGPFTFNDILEELGRERSDDPLMDEQWITKNFELMKGGGTDDKENQN
ncbi:phage portal protein [Enterococcus sp. JM9B]|uniref:phage portal protein n=1 Tax=Enterococcus sp. JM9B TaxID=1857216 RepID=UPI001374BC76|nr:phage portal protein [Enterococcus sp. JM9B]KAF1303673.1 phage portal protein [Enterococcus sp. JM9B]